MLGITRHQHGVSLVESMIALLVISVGLLGIAALQITSISQNSSALHHSQAVWAAYDMSDRIRANDNSFAAYAGIDTITGSYTQSCEGIANVCTSAQIMTADAADWTTMVSNLPSGHGQIIAQADPNELLIAVMWNDGNTTGGGSNGAACPVTTLSCYTVVVTQ